MFSFQGARQTRRLKGGACWIAICLWLGPPCLRAQEVRETTQEETKTTAATEQDDATEQGTAAGGGDTYVPAIELLPGSLAGLVRIPNLPKFCDAWSKTHIGQLLDDESMQPYIDSQRDRAIDYLESFGSKVGLRPQDLYDIASGEVVVAWLPFENDKRRPFALCVVADIRGLRAEADEAVAKIDNDLKAGGWERMDAQHRDQTILVYNNKPKPGQLKVEQIAISLDDTRIIASDRDSVVTDLLDAIAGDPKSSSISIDDDFKTVLTRSGQAIREPVKEGGGIISGEWFARPFQMGRIVRESLEIDRGNDVDILKLLENQGFDALKAAGGVFAIAGNRYDILHRGFILAPPTTSEPSKYEQAARMLQFPNLPISGIPSWVHSEAASFNRVNLKIEDAFWASETLINEALGDEIFRDIIDGIRDDEDGPQIDIAKNVLPNLDDQLIVITDNTTPTDLQSERMLVAIRVRNAEAIKSAIRKAMEVEPDAKLLEDLPGTEIWRVERGGEAKTSTKICSKIWNLDSTMKRSRSLHHCWTTGRSRWSIKDLVPSSPYLMFSNDSDLLILIAKRIAEGGDNGLAAEASIEQVIESLKDLGCKDSSFDRAVRMKLSLRAKYELLRQGKLKESGSVMASFYRRFLQGDEEEEDPDPLKVETLPPLEKIERYLPDGGSFFETERRRLVDHRLPVEVTDQASVPCIASRTTGSTRC